MDRNNDRIKMFTRRAVMVGAMQAGLLGVLGWRLGWLQLSQGQKYRMLAENNRINIKMLAPTRGLIMDRHGIGLAINDQNFRVVAVPEQTPDLLGSLHSLQKLIDLSEHEIQRALRQAERQPSFVPVEVKQNLSWDEVAKVEVNLPDLPGLSINVGEIRSYPFGEASAHIIGYVGAVSKAELTGDPLLTMPGFRIGKTGIEKAFDTPLRGKAGTAEVEVNVAGREVRELNRYSPTPGRKLWLTIDSELQAYAQERLATERSGSAVIMDVKSGAIYALASHPAFDPNMFSRGLSATAWEELLADPTHPLNNKAIGGQYPPGSTFKMVTALACLEEGVINRNSTSFCPGHYDFGGHRFHCWKRPGHGRADVVKALAESCDVFFYKYSTELGIDKLAEYAHKLGIGHRLGFEMMEERPGLMPNRAWKRGISSEPWQAGETIVASIGQGSILATPMQLAVMTSRLVNGGYAVRPWITGYIGERPAMDTNWSHLGFRQENIDLILRGMDWVVNHSTGTARGSRIHDPDMAMGGKTGTAQVRRITPEERAAGLVGRDVPWHLRHHALFVGYAPVDNPRYACAVVVEHGGGGSAVAAPIARDLMVKVQELNPADTPIQYESDTADNNSGGGTHRMASQNAGRG